MLALVILTAALGLAVGSFLNVVIWRVPRGESVVRPPSHCPGCDRPIRPRDNVPVLSWLLLRGKCRDCGEAISLRYPLVELGTSVLFAVLTLSIGFEAELPAFLYLGAIGVALAMIDIDVKRLPRLLVRRSGRQWSRPGPAGRSQVDAPVRPVHAGRRTRRDPVGRCFGRPLPRHRAWLNRSLKPGARPTDSLS